MAILIYYSHNHKCFRTKWGRAWESDIGHVNGFNEELYGLINFYPQKQKTKTKIIEFLKRVIYRLETPREVRKQKVVYIEKIRYPWWKR